jgi:hypothetical protein
MPLTEPSHATRQPVFSISNQLPVGAPRAFSVLSVTRATAGIPTR